MTEPKCPDQCDCTPYRPTIADLLHAAYVRLAVLRNKAREVA